ncbi:alpha/beta fold hydrolase [Actinocorallia longicatena]
MIPSPRKIRAAASNTSRKILYGRLADLRSSPADLLDGVREGTVRRYRPARDVVPTGPPVLLVPPPAAGAGAAFDLRRGCSLAEHLVATGRRTYLVDYGQISYADRDLGLEHWVDELLPAAVRRVSEDAGGQPVQLVGWCLGGIFSVLAAAARPGLPIAAIASVGAVADLGRVAPAGALRPLVENGRKMLGIDRYLLRPLTVLTNLDNADLLAQIEAVDAFSDRTAAGPGRSAGERYRSFFRDNDLAGGRIVIAGREVRLADVNVPVLAIAGRSDAVAPWQSVHPLTRTLTGSPRVRFDTAPGGHLGVLTGRAARTTTWARLGKWLDEGALEHGLRASRPRREAAAR